MSVPHAPDNFFDAFLPIRLTISVARRSASEEAGAFLFGLFVAIFARIHPSPKESWTWGHVRF
jgi:hypothetical protein